MRKLLSVIVIVFPMLLFPQTDKELRGVWITNVDSYVLNDDMEIAKALDYLSSVGINVIFPVMWNNGSTLYPSNIMNNLFHKPISTAMSGRDPLKRLVIEAHRNGIEVIPWMEYGFSSSYVTGGNISGDSIIKKFPSWVSKTNTGAYCIDGDGSTGFLWMSGINPDVQNFMISLCSEMLDNYDIDGIQGDDRLPALPVEGGYDSVTVSIYKSEHSGVNPPGNFQDSDWKRWRADKLNQFFWRMRDSIKIRSSNLILSSAPSPYYWGYNDHLQDSKTWVDSGLVDNFIPQIYPDPPDRSFAGYQYILQRTLQDISPDKKYLFFPGVLAKVGNYVIPSAQIVNCVNENRKNNLQGETYFFYEGIANVNKVNGDTLKNSVYSHQAILPYRNGNIWRPKGTIVNEDDSILVTTTGHWLVAKSPALGFKPNILYTHDDTNYTSISYSMNIPNDAWYGVYAWVEPNPNYSNNVVYKVFTGADSITITVDQTNIKNKGWYKLQDAYLLKGIRRVVKLDNTGLIHGKYMMADAVMLLLNRKKSPDVIVTSVENDSKSEKDQPQGFFLGNNFPNPFNPFTTIRFSIPFNSYVSLVIYDILGKEIKTLVNGNRTAGNYEIKFNAEGLSSGVYIYRIVAGDFIQNKKMIVLK